MVDVVRHQTPFRSPILSQDQSFNRFARLAGVVFWGAVAWLMIGGFLALMSVARYCPKYWIGVMVFGPPAWLLCEVVREKFSRSPWGRAISEPSATMQRVFKISTLVLGLSLAYWLWWIETH